MVEKVAVNRDQTTEFCQNQLELWRTVMLTKIGILTIRSTATFAPSLLEITKIIRQAQGSLRLLKANVNPSLVVGNLLLSYPF
jgi:hypothetical protein